MIEGTVVLTTNVGTAVRAWLIVQSTVSRSPMMLPLGDYPFQSTDESDAYQGARRDSQSLQQLLDSLTEDQFRALVQQESGDQPGPLIDRILRYWQRPRLDGVDWLRCGPGRESYDVPKFIQDEPLDLSPGTQVMLSGDGFPDLHATVAHDAGESWTVTLHWDTWDR